MKIETIKEYYDYSWRLHNPEFKEKCNPDDVNITKHIRATDIHGKTWDLLDNGNRYDNEIYQNSHSRYDLILGKVIMNKTFEHVRGTIEYEMPKSDYSNVIFRLYELEPNFNPETINTIILDQNMQKGCKEHYIGFAINYIDDSDRDYSKYPKEPNEDPEIQKGIRCEMRSPDKMFYWLNEHNPMNGEEFDERCRKQTQIIALNNKSKDDAINELNDAIMNEITILDLGGDSLLEVIYKVKEKKSRINTRSDV